MIGRRSMTLGEACREAGKTDYGLSNTLLTRRAWAMPEVKVHPIKRLARMLGMAKKPAPLYSKYFGAVEWAWYKKWIEHGSMMFDMNNHPTNEDAAQRDWVIIQPAPVL